jgi:mono/diheme cytochrome c family protein
MKKIVIAIVLTVLAAPVIALADGRSDYKAKCAGCHGANGMVNPKKAKALQADFKKLTLTSSKMNKTDMIAIVEKGKDKMPGFEKELTKEQMAAIVDYITGLSRL